MPLCLCVSQARQLARRGWGSGGSARLLKEQRDCVLQQPFRKTHFRPRAAPSFMLLSARDAVSYLGGGRRHKPFIMDHRENGMRKTWWSRAGFLAKGPDRVGTDQTLKQLKRQVAAMCRQINISGLGQMNLATE